MKKIKNLLLTAMLCMTICLHNGIQAKGSGFVPQSEFVTTQKPGETSQPNFAQRQAITVRDNLHAATGINNIGIIDTLARTKGMNKIPQNKANQVQYDAPVDSVEMRQFTPAKKATLSFVDQPNITTQKRENLNVKINPDADNIGDIIVDTMPELTINSETNLKAEMPQDVASESTVYDDMHNTESNPLFPDKSPENQSSNRATNLSQPPANEEIMDLTHSSRNDEEPIDLTSTPRDEEPIDQLYEIIDLPQPTTKKSPAVSPYKVTNGTNGVQIMESPANAQGTIQIIAMNKQGNASEYFINKSKSQKNIFNYTSYDIKNPGKKIMISSLAVNKSSRTFNLYADDGSYQTCTQYIQDAIGLGNNMYHAGDIVYQSSKYPQKIYHLQKDGTAQYQKLQNKLSAFQDKITSQTISQPYTSQINIDVTKPQESQTQKSQTVDQTSSNKITNADGWQTYSNEYLDAQQSAAKPQPTIDPALQFTATSAQEQPTTLPDFKIVRTDNGTFVDKNINSQQSEQSAYDKKGNLVPAWQNELPLDYTTRFNDWRSNTTTKRTLDTRDSTISETVKNNKTGIKTTKILNPTTQATAIPEVTSINPDGTLAPTANSIPSDQHITLDPLTLEPVKTEQAEAQLVDNSTVPSFNQDGTPTIPTKSVTIKNTLFNEDGRAIPDTSLEPVMPGAKAESINSLNELTQQHVLEKITPMLDESSQKNMAQTIDDATINVLKTMNTDNLILLLFYVPKKATAEQPASRPRVWSAITSNIADNLGIAQKFISAPIQRISQAASKTLDAILGEKAITNEVKQTRINQLITNTSTAFKNAAATIRATPTTISDFASGSKTTFDRKAQTKSVVKPDESIVNYTYKNGKVDTKTINYKNDPKKSQDVYTYDSNGKVASLTTTDKINLQNQIHSTKTQYQYGPRGNKATATITYMTTTTNKDGTTSSQMPKFQTIYYNEDGVNIANSWAVPNQNEKGSMVIAYSGRRLGNKSSTIPIPKSLQNNLQNHPPIIDATGKFTGWTV